MIEEEEEYRSSREDKIPVELDNVSGLLAFLCRFKLEVVPEPDYSKPKKYIEREIKEFERVFAGLDPAKRNKVARALFECVLLFKLELIKPEDGLWASLAAAQR